MQVGDAIHLIKDAHLITYVRYVLENNTKEFFLLQTHYQ
jgi:hypothetical protein